MRILIPVTLAALLAVLSGCTHMQNARYEADRETLNVFCNAQYADGQLTSLRSAIVPDASTASVAQLTDTRSFTIEQKQALSVFDGVMQQCYTATLAFVNQYEGPGVSSVFRQHFDQEKLLRAQAVSTQMTVGEYNTARAKIAGSTNVAIAAARERRQQQLAAEAAQSAAAWAAVSSSLQQAQQTQIMQQQLYQQQMQSYRPINTNCSRFGNQVNCTSW